MVGVRLGWLIWALCGPAQRTSSLCSTAPTEASVAAQLQVPAERFFLLPAMSGDDIKSFNTRM